MILIRSNRSKDALALATGLVDRSPQSTAFRDTLALVSIEQRDFKSAISHYERCLSLEPENALWAARIVRTLLDSGDREAAKTRFREFDQRFDRAKMAPAVRKEWEALERDLK